MTAEAVATGHVHLEAGDAAAIVAPEEGGMLLSLRVGDTELLAQRRAGDAPVPMFGSYLLAPWVGELALGKLAFRGTHAEIPVNQGRHAVHGLVVDGAWQVEAASTSTVRMTRHLERPWPFGGTVTQEIALDAAGITLEAEIRAGDAPMPAALGWHPWFACPDPSQVRVGVHADHRLELDDELLPTGRILLVDVDTDLRAAPTLGRRRLDTVFVGATSPATIATQDIELEVHFDLQIDTVVVYASPGAVCVEPWSAWPNALAAPDRGHPSGVAILEPGDNLRRRTRWQWRTDRSDMDNRGARRVPSSQSPLPTEWTKLPRRAAE